MKTELVLLWKKGWKNRLCLLPVLLSLCIFVLVYYQYSHAQRIAIQNGIREPEIYDPGSNYRMMIGDMREIAEDDPLYPLLERQVEIEKQRMEKPEEGQESDWRSYCLHEAAKAQASINELMGSPYPPEDEISYYRDRREYHLYFYETRLPFVNQDDYRTGVKFLMHMTEGILFVLSAVTLSYILSSVLGTYRRGTADKSDLLPLKKRTVYGSRILYGTLLHTAVLFLYAAACLVPGAASHGTGIFSWPAKCFGPEGFTYMPFGSLLGKALVLSFLFSAFLSALACVLSRCFSDPMKIFLSSAGIPLGMMAAAERLKPCKAVAHALPGTYMNAFRAVSGTAAYATENMNVSFTNGCICLLSWTLMLVILLPASNGMKRILQEGKR